ncbi:BMP family ABC transporter substrate-binding protein [Chloroflexus islandicus]|uniref:BMP family ABC transporter substrate-binding protein n=1 Tax=Chloroflexus islandicus TaxID=1707952 RepID=A0A178MJU3_9CHLR|nr:BMP family ABC transporter substrate-binding protein [Chloroflexus islandicus]OAN48397.1 BMP family ABC transporter substrate-binding protein [Chloroflexus islandicus]
MRNRSVRWLVLVLTLISLILTACGTQPAAQPTAAPAAEPTTAPAAPAEEFTFGMVLVGPINDGGWNQAHYEGAQYVVEHVPGVKFIYIDKVNPADRPNVKVEQAIEELIGQGAKLIITNSAEFADGTNIAAAAHPDVFFIHASGDKVLTGEAPPNVRNLMGRMEYGKMIAGCAAALTTEAGKLAYLGPLIDPETRRLVNSTYLGARYCWETYRGRPASELAFKVTWIGFWFNIPGVTLDPTKVANDFINEGYDVILSGIDTTEGIVEANKATQAGKRVFAVPYDFAGACAQGEAVCLGVPYFNWGPDYKRLVELARAGKWEPAWEWTGPNWSNINDPDTSMIGFVKGPALSAENAAKLDEFIAKLADGSLNLFTGPLFYQDGTVFVPEGQVADDKTIWYTQQLLAGIEGQSAP